MDNKETEKKELNEEQMEKTNGGKTFYDFCDQMVKISEERARKAEKQK